MVASLVAVETAAAVLLGPAVQQTAAVVAAVGTAAAVVAARQIAAAAQIAAVVQHTVVAALRTAAVDLQTVVAVLQTAAVDPAGTAAVRQTVAVAAGEAGPDPEQIAGRRAGRARCRALGHRCGQSRAPDRRVAGRSHGSREGAYQAGSGRGSQAASGRILSVSLTGTDL